VSEIANFSLNWPLVCSSFSTAIESDSLQHRFILDGTPTSRRVAEFKPHRLQNSVSLPPAIAVGPMRSELNLQPIT
jgi:hypothetical protein